MTNDLSVTVNLKTSIRQEGDLETFSFTETGSLIQMGDTLYLRYTEHQGEYATPVVFKFLPDGEVSLKRSGQSQSHLRFKTDQSIPTRYATGQGSMLLDVHTTQLKTDVMPNQTTGTATISYELLAGPTHLGEYTVQLHFQAN